MLDAYWRASNYLSVGHVFRLPHNPLLSEPLKRQTSSRDYWGIGERRLV